MLRDLSIRNFAIIDDLQIHFSEGLTVLSGETGAGKSIIINAVNLLLGSRATTQLIRTGTESAELEAYFEIHPESSIAGTLKNHGYDTSDGLLIRRIISRNERSRIYVNGGLATISLLNQITENLASISGQHAHQGLLKEENHLYIIDQFGGLILLRNKLRECYRKMQPLIQRLSELNMLKDRRAEQTELYRFQQKEIKDVGVTPGEDSALEQERIRLRNGAALVQAVTGGIDTIYDADGAIIERLMTVKNDMEKAGEIDPELGKMADGLNDAAYQLEDVTDKLRSYLNRLVPDDRRLEAVEERLDTLNRLKRKYGGSLESVQSHLNTIEAELSGIETIPQQIEETEKRLRTFHENIVKLANRLSEKRKQTAKNLSRKVKKELASLQMPQTEFEVHFSSFPADKFTDPYLSFEGQAITETGKDRAAFLIAPNVGESLKPLASIVSGGELSRIILSLKAILAKTESVETIVFDEVDAGIGGSVAEMVGKKLTTLSKYHQVLCITHLPQIAKFGNHHFQISKHVSRGRTRTTISPLEKEQRVEELARMLGGVEITEKTRSHARELLQSN